LPTWIHSGRTAAGSPALVTISGTTRPSGGIDTGRSMPAAQPPRATLV
jgi:hypothetical protein